MSDEEQTCGRGDLSPILSPDDLAAHMASNAGLVIIDARSGDDVFAAGHLPSAIHADLQRDLSSASSPGFDPRTGGRHPLPPLETWLARVGSWGIDPATEVIVYDESDGSNAAARTWWMLRSIGHENVRVLDGGFRAAIEAGLPVTTSRPEPRAREPYPALGWNLATVDRDEVNVLRQSPEWKVLDVRSGPRFRGETEPFDPVAGHIPGAVNLPFPENMDSGRWKAPRALREQYERLLEGTPTERLIVHCGSGVTACHTLLALHAAGLDGAALYVGSWSEWCRSDMPRS